MEQNGSLNSLLGASVAVGVLQILNPGPEPVTGQTGMSNLVNQLLAAYTGSSTSSASNSSTSTDPGLAVLQDMEANGSLGSTTSTLA